METRDEKEVRDIVMQLTNTTNSASESPNGQRDTDEANVVEEELLASGSPIENERNGLLNFNHFSETPSDMAGLSTTIGSIPGLFAIPSTS